MGRYADHVLLMFIAFLAAWTACALAALHAALCLGISFACLFACGFASAAWAKRGKLPGRVSFQKWCLFCRLEGDERLKKTALKVFCTLRAAHEQDGLIFTGGYAVAVFARFAPLSNDSAAALLRKCSAVGLTQIHILSPCRESRAKALALRCGVRFEQLSFRKFYALACGAGEVPLKTSKKIRRTDAFKSALPLLFTRAGAVRACFAAFMLCLLSYLTPLKTYYLAISAVTLAFALSAFAVSCKNGSAADGPLSPPAPLPAEKRRR